MPRFASALILACSLLLASEYALAQTCLECHRQKTPLIVTDWELSRHSRNGVGCEACHGTAHTTAADASEALLATPATCGGCHPERVEQFSRGKHAMAWDAVTVMPTTHWQPMALLEGLKGCTGCHKIGLKDEKTLRELRAAGSGYGAASCDSCHTRHTFSAREARQPQACRTCHMGFDHPQWEMYESSKHGVRFLLRQSGVLPVEAPAPTCRTCHMPDGNHEVRTAWGFLAVRLPLPEDEAWAEDQTTVLTALGVLDPNGNATARLNAVKKVDAARLTREAFQAERERMLAVCGRCHSASYARNEMEKGDKMVRVADGLLAGAIREVAGLYADGVLQKPENYAYAYPDLLTFHDAPTPIEAKLWVMYLEHRMRTFQGAFHMNPDYTLWYGWSEMVRDRVEISEMAARLRAEHAAKKAPEGKGE